MLGVGVHPLHHARVDAEPRGEREAAAVDDAEVDLARAPVIRHRQQVLGGIDDVAGDPEHLAEHVRRAARQAAQGGRRAEQAVRGFVDGAVAAERDNDVVVLVRRLAAELGGVAARLGVDRVDLEATLERVHDEVAEAVGNRARVRVDDDQHAPAGGRPRELEVVGARRGVMFAYAGGAAHGKGYTAAQPALPGRRGPELEGSAARCGARAAANRRPSRIGVSACVRRNAC